MRSLVSAAGAGLLVGLAAFFASAASAAEIEASTRVDLSPLITSVLELALVMLGSPIAVLAIRVLAKVGSRVGFDLDDRRRLRLQEIVEHGLRYATSRLEAGLADRPLAVDVRNQVLAEAARYTVQHGAETIRKLKGDPADLEAIVKIVEARTAGWLVVSPAADTPKAQSA